MTYNLKNAKKIMPVLLISTLVGCQNIDSQTRVNETTTSTSIAGVKVGNQESNSVQSYKDKLFNQSYVHTIDIEISEEDWKDLLANPLDKTKYKVNATIDGEKIEDVSFATKGNTSLSSVASDKESDRYSFKLNFGKYVKGQTYYGLDKLNLNNIYADATYMKDYMAYEIFKAVGVEAPLTSYVSISINGQNFGLYLALEEVGESYLERAYGGEGDLYKPETEQLNQAGNKFPERPEEPDGPKGIEKLRKDADENGLQKDEPVEEPTLPEKGERLQIPESQETQKVPIDGEIPKPEDMESPRAFKEGDKGPGGFGESDKGASLSYTDDELESYTDIFDNAETDVTDEDKNRVIEALKKLSEGTNLEDAINTDEVIRYFVAHNFVLNGDSYTGNMLHNYYLYENEGKLSMLPWDYNLAFGTFMGGGRKDKDSGETIDNSTLTINTAIDTPLGNNDVQNRPMWAWIANNETYMKKYHEYFEELITNYFTSGECEKEIDRVYKMILPYVENDPSAFYNVDEFKKGYEALKTFCLLRAQSIKKQLDGELAATTSEQKKSEYVDASTLIISDMGTQGKEQQKAPLMNNEVE